MTRQSNRFNEVRRYVAGVDLAGNADHYVCGPRKDDGTHDIEHFGSTTNELLRMAVARFHPCNPRTLAALRDGRCRESEAEIAEQLTGTWREEHLFNLKQAYETLCFLDGRISDYDVQIRAMYAKIVSAFPPVDPPPEGGGRKPKDKEDARAKADLVRICGGFDMTKIDGIGYDSAATILSELGPRLDAFPTESHFVSYIGAAPALGKGAGKNVSTRRKHKNTSRVGQVLKIAASTLSRSESSLGARFRSVRSRTCSRTAIKDVSREMAKRIYRGLKYGQAYVDEGEIAYMARTRERTIKAMKKKISKLNISAEELGVYEVAM